MPRDDFGDRNEESMVDGTIAGFLVLNRMRNIAMTVRDAKQVGTIKLEIDGIEANIDDWLDLVVDISNEMFMEHSEKPEITRPAFKRYYEGNPDREDLLFMKNIFLQMNMDLMDEAGLHPGEIKGKDVGNFLEKMINNERDGDQILEMMTKELGIPKEQILEDIKEMQDMAKKAEGDPFFSGPEGMEETVAEIDPQHARMVSTGSSELGALLGRPLPEPFLPMKDVRLTFDYDGEPIKDLQKIIDEIDMTLSAS